jgi:aldehyde:ferredoxin oxidoreductase
MSYQWKVLRVNLSTGISSIEPLNKKWAEQYFGGRGLGAKYLYEELPKGVKALSPENKVIFATGPLTGTIVPCSGKLAVLSKSPATGGIVDSSIGGTFASNLKYAGYDLLIVEGKAKLPVYLEIENDRVEIHNADGLWGKGINETEKILKSIHGVAKAVLSIGPAGENLLPFACAGSDNRQAGRGGIGAVMGSKNLKAIICSGTKGLAVADMPGFLELVKKLMLEDTLSGTNSWVYTTGTPMIVDMSNASGIFPTRNYQDGVFESAASINAEKVQNMKPEKKACFACALGCGNYVRYKGRGVEGPEYETLALAGAGCGISDLEAIIQFNAECDDLGLDTISTGNVLGFAMEMTEKGIKDFGIKFGDVAGFLTIPRLIALKKGIGQELSLGVKQLSRKYGGTEFAMQVKGLEIPGYDPRGSWGMGLAYATASRGGCHMSAWPVADEAFGKVNPFTIEGKAQLVISGQNINAIKFSLILCDFWALSLETMSQLMSCLFARDVSISELEKAGERIWNILRLFNVREGLDVKDDSLPERIFKDALKSGVTTGKVLPRDQFSIMLQEYYQLRGWNKKGIPLPEKLMQLNMQGKG